MAVAITLGSQRPRESLPEIALLVMVASRFMDALAGRVIAEPSSG